jgi:hypothetical protein
MKRVSISSGRGFSNSKLCASLLESLYLWWAAMYFAQTSAIDPSTESRASGDTILATGEARG